MMNDIFKIVYTVAALALAFGLLWSFTGAPMRANYRECGTIFLCKNQH